MRISELSRRSAVTIPTIKYYLREGLLPPGEVTGRNQARYGEEHLHRLRLIRALREVGGLSVAAAGEVLACLADPPTDLHQLMGRAHRAVITPDSQDRDSPAWQEAYAYAQAWIEQLGWQVNLDGPAVEQLASVIVNLRQLGHEQLLTALPRYAEAARRVAEPEVAAAMAHPDPAEIMTAVVTGTVFGERLFAAVRLLAHEHVSATRADQGEGGAC